MEHAHPIRAPLGLVARIVGLVARIVVGFALAILPGCAFLGSGAGDAGITFATEPPGARVLIDGKDSGFVTPCRLALDPGDAYAVELQLEGYATARIRLEPATHVETVLWKDMYVRSVIWHFPLWLDMKDTFQPVEYESTLAPGRVYARLERAADQ